MDKIVVFRPGGVAGGIVYTDPYAMCTYLLTVPGWKQIDVDLSLVSDTYTFPTGALHPGPQTTWNGLINPVTNNYTTLVFGNGTTIQDMPFEISDLSISVTQSEDVILNPGATAGSQFYCKRSTILSSSGGAFLRATNGQTLVYLHDSTATLNSGKPVLVSSGTGSLAIAAYDNAQIIGGSISLAGNGDFISPQGLGQFIDQSYAPQVGQVLRGGMVWAPVNAIVDPNNVVNGKPGAIYVDNTGNHWVKAGTGNTGWSRLQTL